MSLAVDLAAGSRLQLPASDGVSTHHLVANRVRFLILARYLIAVFLTDISNDLPSPDNYSSTMLVMDLCPKCDESRLV
ncbi:hypothetical protein DdX_22168 [Ditylenchus destructor]|uniref:Uncharacterized protein n=1 Tax=Ditylenchus destructor TaxID=166010 RepID=A0AAD4QSN5_9BILA|nr:hypothetical protein DdX_22168 [Ditylenchus destructor]